MQSAANNQQQHLASDVYAFPTSFAQQRLWFLEQLEPHSPAYNVPFALRVTGRLDITALQQSFDAIVERHEALRTTFTTRHGAPVQIITPSVPAALPVVTLSSLSAHDRDATARRLAVEEARRPFDLVKGPLWRVTVLCLHAEEHLVLLSMHHIVSDGWSMDIFFRELSALYGAFSQGKASPLPALSLQYVDFAIWQRQWLQGEALEQQLGYWRKQLAGLPTVQLPTDRPRPAVPTHRGAVQSCPLSPALVAGLQALSRREGTTLFMTLLAAFQTLLSRYTGQEDIVVGSPIANRHRAEIEGLIGCFVNTLVLRTDLSGTPTFRDVLRRVRHVALEAFEHQDLPFEKLVEDLKPERELNQSPLFQVLFVWRNVTQHTIQRAGLTLSARLLDIGIAKFDVTLTLEESGVGLRAIAAYNTEVFDAPTIKRLLGHYERLLQSIVADPEQRIATLPILTEHERHQLLVEWNDTRSDFRRDTCIHELFEAQADASPNAVAVVCGEQRLTYAELNRQANQLARYLRQHGVGPEVLVGICLERSLAMAVAILAVLKAGGAYVPLDTDYPPERLQFMLHDAGVAMLLTQAQCLGAHRARGEKPMLCLDADWGIIASESTANLAQMAHTHHLAYVIYTSGSTGTPKGVAVDHKALGNYTSHIIQRLQPAAGHHFAMVQPLTFDSCLTMIFPCLLTGGTLHVLSREHALSAAQLDEYVQRWSIDFLKITPSHLAALQAASSAPERLMPRRGLVVGGEGSQWHWVRSLQALAPRCTIFNHYGPTEATVGVLMYKVDPHAAGTDHLLHTPLGRPIANTQVYVLDAQRQPVPAGIPGELYIGGDNLARGYHHRPALTAEKFVPHPFSHDTSARLYRTGDLARYLPDGNLEFLGRTDNQVKIRGFRVEPGEIEAALLHHPAVHQVIVIPWGDLPETQRLVAYIVAEAEGRPNAPEVREFLTAKLPEHMIPAAYVFVDALPRTPHGKVDRAGLPAPDLSRSGAGSAFVAPRSETEKRLAEIWVTLLKLNQVGVHDSFFELGGHSLLAMQLVSKIRDVIQVELPVRRLFETPSIAGLAVWIDKLVLRTANCSSADVTEFVALMASKPATDFCRHVLGAQGDSLPEEFAASAAADEKLPVSFTQERFWLLDRLAPNPTAYNSVQSFRVLGALHVVALEQSLAEIVQRHEALRTNIKETDGQPFQVVRQSPTFKLCTKDMTDMAAVHRTEAIHRLAEQEAWRPFDLAHDLMLRGTLVRCGTEEYVLLLVYHHIANDHWSSAVFWDELEVLYAAFCAGLPSPLPPLSYQYRHYATWQRQLLQGQVLDEHLAYWHQQLQGPLAPLQLPTDSPRPPVQTSEGEVATSVLPASLMRSLHALSQREHVTLFMTLLAACKVLLHRLTGQEDIIVGSPVAGRNRSETEPLIGCFLNLLVLRTEVSSHLTFRQVLARVRDVALGAYEHQELPFENLLTALAVRRDPSRTPLFQVFFNMFNFTEREPRLPELMISRFELPRPAANFDITWYVREYPDGTHLQVLYNTDLFTPNRMMEMLAQYTHLLQQIVANPDQCITAFSLVISSPSRALPDPTQPLSDSWHGAVHERLALQAQQVPHQIAIIDQWSTWTYADLNTLSNQVAHYLLAQGIQPEEVVAIYGHRSASLVCAVLGVLKAGAAFLILDPAYPSSRLMDCLQQAQPRGWLQLQAAGPLPPALQEFCQTLPLLAQLQIPAHLAAFSTSLLGAYAAENPPVTVHQQSLAYVSFTSGSTGRPKGILGQHGSLSHFLPWQAEVFQLRAQDRFSMLSGLSHDPLQRDMFTPLWVGARLCIPNPDFIGTAKLADWIARAQITFMHVTPPMLQAIVDTAPADCSFPALRSAFFVGDKLTSREVTRLRHLAPDVHCIGSYGTTETQRAVGIYLIPKRADVAASKQKVAYPLGRGIDDVQLLVLTGAHRLAGVGEPGEIYVRSPHLARGYLGDEALTQARFFTNPFTGVSSDRLYKTGDVGRYLPDGNVEFVRRADRQLKIHGFRIEPEEIEAVLVQHAAVKEVVVLAREDHPDDLRLVAYAVPRQDATTTTNELRSFLKTKLPTHMMPSALVLLAALPLTPNGKVDHHALPAPDQSRLQLAEAFVVPRTPIEQTLAAIWSEVLQRQDIGIHENFFVLGGHSLLAMQMFARVQQALHIWLPLRTIFEQPTIEALASEITKTMAESVQQDDLARIIMEPASPPDEETRETIGP